MSLEMKKLAIFDMDGTLFNTDEVNYTSYKKALNKYKYDITYQQYKDEMLGKAYKDFLPKLVDITLVETIHNEKINLYVENIHHAKINQSLFDIIDSIKGLYFIALVTTASKNNTFDLLNYFNKISSFDLIITSNDVSKNKPDPEGFLKAMEYFKVSPENTIIFEDSEIGVKAAKQTKAQIYIVSIN